MTKPFLTIIIPTWNRCTYLKKNLEILLPLVDFHNEEVSVYISDNASDDDTPAVIEQAKAAYPQIVTSFRQSTNIGGQKNFVDAVSKIDSTYFVLLGDDDYVMPFYFDFVLRILKETPKTDWLCYNGTRVDNFNRFHSLRTSIHVSGHERIYNDGAEMVKDLLEGISLMSQNVYRRELFLEGMNRIKLDDYPGYLWFAIMCFQIVGKHSCYCDIPLIENGYNYSDSPWLPNWPWYCIYGLGKLFKDLDECYAGTYLSWMKALNGQKNGRMHILKVINQNRSLYGCRIREMLKYANTKLFSKQMFVYAKYPAFIATKLDKAYRGYALLDRNMKVLYS